MGVHEDEDVGDNFWGRTEERQFSYTVCVPASASDNAPAGEVVLTAVQDRQVCSGTPAFPSHGHCVWDAALLLADYLQARALRGSNFRGKKVVELGAGVGLVGMALAALGANVALTDQAYALPLLHKNVAVNFPQEQHSKTLAPAVEACQWGEHFETGGCLQRWTKSTDVVVFSDVLYHESASLLLVQTLLELAGPTTDVFFSFESRNAAIEARFLHRMAETFEVTLISREDNASVFASFEYPEELFLYHAQLKSAV